MGLQRPYFRLRIPKTRLLSRNIKVPQLQSLVNEILSRPSWSITESDIFELIQTAEDLDGERIPRPRRNRYLLG
jgi:hypothetical protein